MKTARKILDFLLSSLFPNRCSVCGEVIEHKRHLCDNCKRFVAPIFSPVCHKCGVSLCDHNEEKCKEISAPVIGAFYYRDSVRRVIIDFKDTKRVSFFNCFSQGFFEKIAIEYAETDFDVVVCVPSYEKGKTTSKIIGKETAEHFFIPFDGDILEKYRATEKQHRLSMTERMTNLKNSIRVRNGKEGLVKDKTVLLCDDVKTTGSTLNECVKALYAAGAKDVYCACVAVSDYTTKKSG